MAKTQLSPTATPGKRWSFLAKDAAAPVTELSVMGVPGRIHSFTAKTAAVGVGKVWLKRWRNSLITIFIEEEEWH